MIFGDTENEVLCEICSKWYAFEEIRVVSGLHPCCSADECDEDGHPACKNCRSKY